MTTKVKLIADGAITPDQITLTTASAGTNTTAPRGRSTNLECRCLLYP